MVFLATFVLSLYCFTLKSETGCLEIVDLGEGVRAHKQVQESMVENHINAEDVIKAYRFAMLKRNKEEKKMIVEEGEDFSLLISVRDKTIVSLEPHKSFKTEGNE